MGKGKAKKNKPKKSTTNLNDPNLKPEGNKPTSSDNKGCVDEKIRDKNAGSVDIPTTSAINETSPQGTVDLEVPSRSNSHKQPSTAISGSQGQTGNVKSKKKKEKKSQSTGQSSSTSELGAPDQVQPVLPSTTTSEHFNEIVPLFKYQKPGILHRKENGIIKVASNHFPLDLSKLKVAYQYDVKIFETVETDLTRRKNDRKKGRRIKNKEYYDVFWKFIKEHFPNRHPSYDGNANMFVSRPLTNNLNEIISQNNITILDDLGRERSLNIELNYVKTLDLEMKGGTNSCNLLPQDTIQCINIILQNAPIHYFTQIGRGYFRQPEGRVINLGAGMEMYHGFYQSVVQGGRPLLNVQLIHKAFPKNMAVLDMFCEILTEKFGRYKGPYEKGHLSNLEKGEISVLNKYIENLKVTYWVPNFPKRIYKVNELAGSSRQEKINSGQTVNEYFRTEKKYDIKFKDAPLLWVGTSKLQIKIPAELCRIEKNQNKKAQDEFLARNMIKYAATDTFTYRENVLKRFREADYNDQKCVQEFGIKVSDQFETMDARVLEPPQLHYKNGMITPKEGKWQSKEFLIGVNIQKWAIVNMELKIRESDLKNLMTNLKSSAKNCGLTITTDANITTVKLTYSEEALEKELKKFTAYQIIFVVLPMNQTDVYYARIKKVAEISIGCLTQCLKPRTVQYINPSTATNIILKVNSKLDGINYTFNKKPSVICDKPVMIMGADVTHPGPIAGNIPSVAAVIASHEPKAFKYNFRFALQNTEYIMKLEDIVVEHLKFFYAKNREQKPHRIFYFRDGVSDGMFSEVLKIELEAIKRACKRIQSEDYNPTITFLVVQKRHHTRIFPTNKDDSEDKDIKKYDKVIHGNYNVPAGTCVDTTIVNPAMQNFYLVSHASIKGVARPTKYYTLYDDLNLSNDEIEELTYYLCHMFSRCNRSVSYPAPTYYAHLGALRGKAYIKSAIDANKFNMEDLEKEMNIRQIQKKILEDHPMFFV